MTVPRSRYGQCDPGCAPFPVGVAVMQPRYADRLRVPFGCWRIRKASKRLRVWVRSSGNSLRNIDYLAAGKNQKRDGIWPYSTLRVQRRKGAVISPAARICPRRSTFWPCARRPLERRHESAKTEARRRIQIPPLLFRWRALNMASLTIPHRDLFKSSLSDRRKGITCPSKYLILAVDTPDSSV